MLVYRKVQCMEIIISHLPTIGVSFQKKPISCVHEAKVFIFPANHCVTVVYMIHIFIDLDLCSRNAFSCALEDVLSSSLYILILLRIIFFFALHILVKFSCVICSMYCCIILLK